MLTGKLVRVRNVRHKLVPSYIEASDPFWLGVAEQLLLAYRAAAGRTRGEIEEELADVVGEGPQALVHQGLAKLLEDRCDYEVSADLPPESIREAAFRSAALHRAEVAPSRQPFDRTAVIAEVCRALNLSAEQVERGLFADLKDEQRVLKFEDITPQQLLHRYNVALAQAVLLRCTEMEVRVWGETPARFRQLFRSVKFHRLICTIRETPGNSYTLRLDGPLSLFSSTQKYGLQLALFLPTLLHCKAFEMQATIRWGTDRKEKSFTLSGTDGLRTHLADFGVYTPPELQMFAESFAEKVKGWTIAADPHPLSLPDGVWVPDFKLTQAKTGQEVFVEIFGFWRKGDIEQVQRRLKKAMPGKFILCVSEQNRTDEVEDVTFGNEVYRYKRTPLPEEVARLAAALTAK